MALDQAKKDAIVKAIVDNPHLLAVRELLHSNPELAIQTMANELAIGRDLDKDKFKAHLTEVAEALGYSVQWQDDAKMAHPEVAAADRDRTVPRHQFPKHEGTVVEGAASAGGQAT